MAIEMQERTWSAKRYGDMSVSDTRIVIKPEALQGNASCRFSSAIAREVMLPCAGYGIVVTLA
jgi:hypothetical protein